MLELLPQPKKRLRCRHCHLTIAQDDLKEGYCPECFDSSGVKQYEFEEVAAERNEIVHYRCEDCGVIIQSR
jgi:predicted RNA-binding Zn-ribbon protein involved in translation (DUF1610 family)